jgi:anaerobic dimethyl sulfoxide reductase subunit B (iron-sulfur subunit)
MEMCDFCTGINIEPACTACCPTEALKFGSLDELSKIAKGKGAKRMSGVTEPSVIIAGELPVASLIT